MKYNEPACFRILHRKILFCRWLVVALLASVAACAVVATAQEERPQIVPGERKVPRKKDAGPRAVGVLRMTADGKTSLVPIAILINGKFWDASAYKADPVPMALEPGTVYEGERAGSSLGLFTVNSALHSVSANAPTPWIGTGDWTPAGSEKVKTELKAETAPVGIDTSDQPPRLTRDPAKVAQPASAPPASASPSTAPATAPPASQPSGSGDEPPRLTKGVPAPSPAPSGGATQPTPSQPDSGSTAPKTPGDAKSPDSKPGDTKASDSKASDVKPSEVKPDVRASLPASDSGASAENRPTLRRGKPVSTLRDDDFPGYLRPGAVGSAKPPADASKGAQAAADTGPVQMVPAISDATGPDPRSFGFEWLKGEEDERRKQVVTLATEQVRAYVAARAKAQIAPTTAAKTSASKSATKAAPKTPVPILENVHMTTYDPWVTNQPVIVFSAEAHMPPPPAGVAHSDADSGLQYSVLIVAYPDMYNNLHKVYVGVTDKYHLDLTPRLELIDALDADGDGRGELLFREITDGGNGWVIYRPTADKLWKMFDSLHPE